jgi:glutamyl-tRNA reductase
MSVLVVGLSHQSAPVATLERAVVAGDAQVKLLHDLVQSDHVAGSLVLSTCNRVEVYTDVDRFHGGVATICELLARHSGLSIAELTASAYVHYEDRAVQHLLSVACGMESMVVGESQILGQVRHAVSLARQQGTLSRELGDLGRLALRVGKRARAETRIDAAGQNLVTLGVELARAQLGTGRASTGRANKAQADRAGGGDQLAGQAVLVVGAGSMSSLAVATASRLGAAKVVIANRTLGHAERLATRYGADALPMAELPAALDAADLVITCTGAPGPVLTEPMVADALTRRGSRPLVLLDLALPRDVEASAGRLPGARLIDLEAMGATAAGREVADLTALRRIVAQELADHVRSSRAETVTPAVVALRAKAAGVVESELARLERRLGEVDAVTRREIAQAMGRITDKLLHTPTVRVKELAGSPGGDSYETALRVLFALDQEAVRAVGMPSTELLDWRDEVGE